MKVGDKIRTVNYQIGTIVAQKYSNPDLFVILFKDVEDVDYKKVYHKSWLSPINDPFPFFNQVTINEED